MTLSSVRSLHADSHFLSEKSSGLMKLEELEKQHILRVLQETRGNRKKAAIILGINTATVYRKIEKYRISDARFRDDELTE
jgi:transcriptional regulator with PAS, ATPase and Fis domain